MPHKYTMNFEQKLSDILRLYPDNRLNEEYSNHINLYKGISEKTGLEKWPEHTVGRTGYHVPGFLSNYEIATVYSDPSLTGPDNQNSMIVMVRLNKNDIEDRTKEYTQWCHNNQIIDQDISTSLPAEWRRDKSIWTVKNSGSGHLISCYNGNSFVYCGKPIKYEVVKYYKNRNEWKSDEDNPLVR